MKTTGKNLDDLIFENRNKAYGAYDNRKNYSKYMFWALTSAISLFLMVVSAPLIANYFNADVVVVDDPNNVTVILGPVPDKQKVELPEAPKTKIAEPVYSRFIAVNDTQDVVELFDFFEFAENKKPADTGNFVIDVDPITEPGIIDKVEPEIFMVVEEMPEFIGGEAARLKYFGENLRYPQAAKEAGIEGIVHVQFVVDNTGKVEKAVVLRGIGGGCDEEALRVVSGMPDWKPGRQTGKAVSVQFTLPISFKLK